MKRAIDQPTLTPVKHPWIDWVKISAVKVKPPPDDDGLEPEHASVWRAPPTRRFFERKRVTR
jgi:hypothetical protein